MDDSKSNIDALIESLTKRAEKSGLYLSNVTVAASDPEVAERIAQDPSLMAQMLRDGEQFLLVSSFTVGDIAWSDKVQNPDAAASDKEFRAMVTDAPLENFEQIKKDLQAGKPLFDDE